MDMAIHVRGLLQLLGMGRENRHYHWHSEDRRGYPAEGRHRYVVVR